MDKLIQHLRFCGDLNANCHECERYYEMGTDGGTASCVNDLMQKAAAALEQKQAHIDALESERQAWLHDQERNRWIPVTERLPKDWVDVLVRLQCGECVVAVRSGPVWRERWTNTRLDREPTHWMPLPEPPKEDS